jgi:general secretion pathway protein I
MIGSSRGFTLIEVIVAFAILVIGLTSLYQGYGLATQAMVRADNRTIAINRAQSKLAEVGASLPLRAGRFEGKFPDGELWVGFTSCTLA